MKAFSRVPDPFGQHLETAKFEFPFKTVHHVEAIPQGKIHNNVHHIINNPSQHKSLILSLDLSQQLKEDAGKESQNTAITEGNPTSKQLEGGQKSKEHEKKTFEKGQNLGSIFSCDDVNMEAESKKIIEASKVKRPHLTGEQKQGDLPLESNQKELDSHIVFLYMKQQIPKGLYPKKPIFAKEKQASPESKNLIGESPFCPSVIAEKIVNANKDTQDAVRFVEEKEFKGEQHIECSFFNNSVEKEDADKVKNTGFNLIESLVSVFMDEPKRQKSYSVITWKQRRKTIDMTVLSKNGKQKNLGGKRPKSSKILKKSTLQPDKLQLIQPMILYPVFF